MYSTKNWTIGLIKNDKLQIFRLYANDYMQKHEKNINKSKIA